MSQLATQPNVTTSVKHSYNLIKHEKLSHIIPWDETSHTTLKFFGKAHHSTDPNFTSIGDGTTSWLIMCKNVKKKKNILFSPFFNDNVIQHNEADMLSTCDQPNSYSGPTRVKFGPMTIHQGYSLFMSALYLSISHFYLKSHSLKKKKKKWTNLKSHSQKREKN